MVAILFYIYQSFSIIVDWSVKYIAGYNDI